jgi:hypothetical protein
MGGFKEDETSYMTKLETIEVGETSLEHSSTTSE